MTRTVASGACRLLTAGIFLAGLVVAPVSPRAAPIDLAGIDATLNIAQGRARLTLQNLAGKTNAFPRAHGETGHWNNVGPSDWTSGFFPGELWLLYEATGQQFWRDAATAWTLPLAPQAARTDTHDFGFMIGLSFGNLARLTGDVRAKPVILLGALATEPYLASAGSAALLQHGTGPDSEIDTALIYGDYYLVEALLRARAILNPTG